MTRIVPARLDRLDSDAATGPRRTPRRVQPSWRRCRQAGGTLGFRRGAAEPPLCGRPGKQEEAEGAREAVEPAGLGVLEGQTKGSTAQWAQSEWGEWRRHRRRLSWRWRAPASFSRRRLKLIGKAAPLPN